MSIHPRLSSLLSIVVACIVAMPMAGGAEIKGGRLHLSPGETEDRSQCNHYVTVIARTDGSVQVFYHDPASGSLVKKDVAAGQSIQISYWDMSGVRHTQQIRGHCAAAQEALTDTSETPVAQKSTSGGTAVGTSAEATSPPATPTTTAADAPVATATEPASAPSTESAKEPPPQTKPVRAPTELKAMAIPAMTYQPPAVSKTVPAEPAVPSGENYLPTVNTSLGPCAWKHFPIKVFMPSATVSYSQQLETDVRDGFDIWSKVTQGKITFQFVNSSKDADMELGWVASKMKLNNQTESGEANVDYRTTGSERRTLQNPGDIYHAKITFVLLDIDNKPWGPGELRSVALHEIGHALGLMGHSQNAGDIMYFQKNSVSEPSARDVNTLNLLYERVFAGTAQQ
jgi:hypothetical protein